LKHFGAENDFKHYVLNHMDMKLAPENAVKHLVLNHMDMNMKQTRWLQKLQAIIFSSKLEIGGFCITTSIEWMDQGLGGLQGLLVHQTIPLELLLDLQPLGANWHHGVILDLGDELLQILVHGSTKTNWSGYLTKGDTFSTMAQIFNCIIFWHGCQMKSFLACHVVHM
jgi:hypothetical protein